MLIAALLAGIALEGTFSMSVYFIHSVLLQCGNVHAQAC